MQTSISRKAINFDLSENLLKKYYPSKNYRNSWREIKKFLEKVILFIVSILDMYLENAYQWQMY